MEHFVSTDQSGADVDIYDRVSGRQERENTWSRLASC